MQDVLWDEMRVATASSDDDRSTWPVGSVVKMRTSKRSARFAPICGPNVTEVLDELFGSGGVEAAPTVRQRARDLPGHETSGASRTRSGTPTSTDTFRGDPLFAVKLWSLCDDVEPGMGGTPLLAGSHRLFDRYVPTATGRGQQGDARPVPRDPRLAPFAHRGRREADRNEWFLDREVDLDGLPARVIEVHGWPATCFVTHGWVLPLDRGERREPLPG